MVLILPLHRWRRSERVDVDNVSVTSWWCEGIEIETTISIGIDPRLGVKMTMTIMAESRQAFEKESRTRYCIIEGYRPTMFGATVFPRLTVRMITRVTIAMDGCGPVVVGPPWKAQGHRLIQSGIVGKGLN